LARLAVDPWWLPAADDGVVAMPFRSSRRPLGGPRPLVFLNSLLARKSCEEEEAQGGGSSVLPPADVVVSWESWRS
jgi:hypothetical protein